MSMGQLALISSLLNILVFLGGGALFFWAFATRALLEAERHNPFLVAIMGLGMAMSCSAIVNVISITRRASIPLLSNALNAMVFLGGTTFFAWASINWLLMNPEAFNIPGIMALGGTMIVSAVINFITIRRLGADGSAADQ